jgi:Tfp pilus assembly protein PilE
MDCCRDSVVVILAVLAFVLLNRRSAATRRARAEKIRQEATERAAELDRKEAEANAMAAQAQDARAEADRLESSSAEQRHHTGEAALRLKRRCVRQTVLTPTRGTVGQQTRVLHGGPMRRTATEAYVKTTYVRTTYGPPTVTSETAESGTISGVMMCGATILVATMLVETMCPAATWATTGTQTRVANRTRHGARRPVPHRRLSW